MIAMKNTNELLVSPPIDETKLCSKIQRLMNNIKQYYSNDKISNHIQDSVYYEPNNHSYSNTNTSSSFVENHSDNESADVTSTLSSQHDYPDPNNDINQKSVNSRNETISMNKTLKNQTANSNNPDSQNPHCFKSVNLISPNTLHKIMTLEKLIINIEESMERNLISSESIRSRLSNLMMEFKEVKEKLETGTKNELMKPDIFDLMRKLKDLFENFYQIQNEFNSIKSRERELSTPLDKTMLLNKDSPAIPPRRFDGIKPLKERVHISNITSSSVDQVMSANKFSENTYVTNSKKKKVNSPMLDKETTKSEYVDNKEVNDTNIFKVQERKILNIEDFLKKKEETLSNKNNEKLSILNVLKTTRSKNIRSHLRDFSSSNSSINNIRFDILNKFGLSTSECRDVTHIQPKVRNRLSKSVTCIFQKEDGLWKASKLPILKKEALFSNSIPKTAQISHLSETVTNQVINSLKRMGYFSAKEQTNKISNHVIFKSKPKRTVKTKATVNQNRNVDEISKSCTESIYLKKLNSYRSVNVLKNDPVNKRSCGPNPRIYCLETLLKKKKYKLVDENKLNPVKEGFRKSPNSVFQNDNNNKMENEVDLEMLMSLAGNSIKIVHQLVFFPSESIEIGSTENFVKDPRLANIEIMCSCKITVLSTNESLKRRMKPDKGLKVIEIHYNLRKGKALGCINMLRNLAGSMKKEMKIYRSSILLPGGYLKEMSSCSINELVNLSMQMKVKTLFSHVKEINIDGNNHRCKIRTNPVKEKARILKTFSMSCIASS